MSGAGFPFLTMLLHIFLSRRSSAPIMERYSSMFSFFVAVATAVISPLDLRYFRTSITWGFASMPFFATYSLIMPLLVSRTLMKSKESPNFALKYFSASGAARLLMYTASSYVMSNPFSNPACIQKRVWSFSESRSVPSKSNTTADMGICNRSSMFYYQYKPYGT